MTINVSAKDIREAGGFEKWHQRVASMLTRSGRQKPPWPGDRKPKEPQAKDPDAILTEHEEQCLVIAWADAHVDRWPELAMLYAIPNGGGRSKAEGGRLKAEGVKAGVPDLHLPIRRSCFSGLWIEMKRKKGGVVQPDQARWLKMLRKYEHKAIIARGAEEAIAALETYLTLEDDS